MKHKVKQKMQRNQNSFTCKELLHRAASIGLSDTEMCNRAKAKKMKLSRSTLWRIRNDKLKGTSYLSTLLKLVRILNDA